APTALDDEMRAKRAIKYAEKEHQENLSRAREASELGSSLAAAFKQNNCLGSKDFKTLEKLEKIAKKIRTEAGASDDDFELEKKPQDLATAVDSVAKVSASLSDKVIKTPRQVVSAAIIEESNVLLELIRIVRTFASRWAPNVQVKVLQITALFTRPPNALRLHHCSLLSSSR